MVRHCELCGVSTPVDPDSIHYYCMECEAEVEEHFQVLNENTPSFGELLDEFPSDYMGDLEPHCPLW